MNTKMVLTAFGLTALVASPAFAQRPVHHAAASHAYARVVTPANATVSAPDTRAIGTDPDAAIRFELRRDFPTYSGTN